MLIAWEIYPVRQSRCFDRAGPVSVPAFVSFAEAVANSSLDLRVANCFVID